VREAFTGVLNTKLSAFLGVLNVGVVISGMDPDETLDWDSP